MGASWLEVDKLIREVNDLREFPHTEALAAFVRARDVVAETAMVVSLAGLSDDSRAEAEAHDLLARARVAVLEAQLAVRRAQETVALCRSGRERAEKLMAEARALRARDGSRSVLSRFARPEAGTAPAPVTALVRIQEPAAS